MRRCDAVEQLQAAGRRDGGLVVVVVGQLPQQSYTRRVDILGFGSGSGKGLGQGLGSGSGLGLGFGLEYLAQGSWSGRSSLTWQAAATSLHGGPLSCRNEGVHADCITTCEALPEESVCNHLQQLSTPGRVSMRCGCITTSCDQGTSALPCRGNVSESAAVHNSSQSHPPAAAPAAVGFDMCRRSTDSAVSTPPSSATSCMPRQLSDCKSLHRLCIAH